MNNLTCLVPAGDKCGEAAMWSADEAAIYWCDINRFLIHRYETETGNVRNWFFDEPVVAISLSTEGGRLLVALASKLIWWWPEMDKRADHGFHLEGFPDVRFNDGRADPLGNFWVGSMKNNVLENGELGEAGPGMGKLYRVAPSGEVTIWRDDLGISNTLCWSPKRDYFYFADTLANTIYRFRYDVKTGDISDEIPFLAGDARGLPDGSSIDSEGHLWNCRYGGKGILRVDPEGRVVDVLELPVTNITTCAFGGKDLKTLFITTAGAAAPFGERLAGSLYAIEMEVAGMAENKVRVEV